MSKTITVRKWTKEALEAANKVPREEVKAVKHLSKPELVGYINSVWQRGYDVGHREGYEHGVNDAKAAINAKDVSEHGEESEGDHGDV